ncbi:MAG: hypothetical protein J6Z12_04275 [Paludibacteraceae bacterium]|nr:hypothetical protein [Paludibacteraceae bacterium]
MKRIRNIIGLLGMILPWFCLLGYYVIYRSQSLPLTDAFPNSMSITYYVTPVLPMILTAAAIVLITYVGYDWRDRLVTTLSGVCGLLIVLFPCSDSNGVFQAAGIDRVAGYFQTPVAINGYIHNGAAIAFFVLLAVNSFFLFTLGDDQPTPEKKKRNLVYRICAIGMVLSMIVLAVPVDIPHKIFWVEAVALSFFGISWLTKGEFWLKDRQKV